MRTLAIALIAATGLVAAAVATGASAAEPGGPAVQSPQAAAPQLAQYYPGYPYRYWDHPRYRHHHEWRRWHRYDRWRYSEAEELNQQELRRLGVAP